MKSGVTNSYRPRSRASLLRAAPIAPGSTCSWSSAISLPCRSDSRCTESWRPSISFSSSSIRRPSASSWAAGGSVPGTGASAVSVGVAARRSCRIRAISRSRSRRLSVDRPAWGPSGVGDNVAVLRRSSGESRARRFRPARGPVQASPGASPLLALEPSSRSHLAARVQDAGQLILGSAGACTRSEGEIHCVGCENLAGANNTRPTTVAPGPLPVCKPEEFGVSC
jgi:hypothetical protein